MPSHITRRDLARTAWLQSIAFATTATTMTGKPRQHPRAWALTAWAGFLLAHCFLGHRNLHLTSSRYGTVCLYRNLPLGMIARGAVFVTALLASFFAASTLFATTVVLAYLALLASMTVGVLLSGRRSRAPKGTDKIGVPWQHYVIGTVAAAPGAPVGETLSLARTLIEGLPRNSAVVVHPRTPELRDAYQRFGFVPGKGVKMVAKLGDKTSRNGVPEH